MEPRHEDEQRLNDRDLNCICHVKKQKALPKINYSPANELGTCVCMEHCPVAWVPRPPLPSPYPLITFSTPPSLSQSTGLETEHVCNMWKHVGVHHSHAVLSQKTGYRSEIRNVLIGLHTVWKHKLYESRLAQRMFIIRLKAVSSRERDR